MTLITCPDCAKWVSNKAVTCSTCGFPIEKLGSGKTSTSKIPTKRLNPLQSSTYKLNTHIKIPNIKISDDFEEDDYSDDFEEDNYSDDFEEDNYSDDSEEDNYSDDSEEDNYSGSH